MKPFTFGKEKEKSIRIFILSLLAFLILAIPFRGLLRINYAMEVRPAAVLNPVLGIFYGMPAILATTLGNAILDFVSGVPFVQIIAYIIPEFLYAYVPYRVWRRLNKKESNQMCIDGMPKILRFFVAIIASCVSLSLIAGTMIGLFNHDISIFIDYLVFTFVNNVVMNLFLGFPLMVALNKFTNHNKLLLCEKYLLSSSVLEFISILAIIIINFRLNVGVDVSDPNFWEKVYFMCIVAILFITGITIVVIALQMDKDLKEKNYEIGVASTIQESMLPTKFDLGDKHFDIFAFMRPAKSVGGDFYDFYYIDNNHLAFLIADVSGKGIPASLFMMRAVSTIRNYAKIGMEVDEIITQANISLAENNKKCYFVTAWMGILDIESGIVSYCNAGHNPPVIKSKNGKSTLLEMEKSFVLGASPKTQYRRNEFKLKDDDLIFLYTDGVTEAKNKKGEMFTDDRLISSIENLENVPKTVCENIISTVDEFCLQTEQFDDITILALRYVKDNNFNKIE